MSDNDRDNADEREGGNEPQDDEPGRSPADEAKETERRMEESGQESPG
jgi:hypothetical protein